MHDVIHTALLVVSKYVSVVLEVDHPIYVDSRNPENHVSIVYNTHPNIIHTHK